MKTCHDDLSSSVALIGFGLRTESIDAGLDRFYIYRTYFQSCLDPTDLDPISIRFKPLSGLNT
jgi:hypothetical protein